MPTGKIAGRTRLACCAAHTGLAGLNMGGQNAGRCCVRTPPSSDTGFRVSDESTMWDEKFEKLAAARPQCRSSSSSQAPKEETAETHECER